MSETTIKLDVLAFSAHPDDIELAAAGTLIKLVKQGYKVGIIDMTRGEMGSRGTREIRQEEARLAAEAIGVSLRDCLDIPDGHVTVTRENHERVIRMLRKFRPEIVFNHYWKARHADHVATSQIVTESVYLSGLAKLDTGQERFRPKRVLYHQLHYDVVPSFLVDVSKEIDQKWKAIRAHKSQFYDPESAEPETVLSHPAFLEMIETRMKYWGTMIGVTHAEPFYTSEPFAIPDLMKAMG